MDKEQMEQVQAALDSIPEPSLTDEQRFDELSARKTALWNIIAARLSHEDIYYGYKHEQEPEWEQIREIDKELLVLDKKIKGGR